MNTRGDYLLINVVEKMTMGKGTAYFIDKYIKGLWRSGMGNVQGFL